MNLALWGPKTQCGSFVLNKINNTMPVKKNFFILSILAFSTFAGAFMSFIFQTIIARNLSPTEFGFFSATNTLILTVSPLCGFGVAQFILKSFANYGIYAKKFLPIIRSFIFKTTALVISSIILYLFLFYNGIDLTLSLLMLSMIIPILLTEVTSCLFQLERNYIKLALTQSIVNWIKPITLLISIYFFSKNIYTVVISIFISSIIASILLFPSTIRFFLGSINLKNYNFTLPPQKNITIKNVIIESIPFGMSGFFYLIYFQLNILLLKLISSSLDAGIYSVAFIIISATTLIPNIIYQKFLLPKLHVWAYHEYKKLKKVYSLGNILMLTLGMLIAISIYLLAPLIINNIFGERYHESIIILKYLSFCIPFYYISSNAGAILNTRNLISIKIKCMGITAIYSVISNIIFIYTMGIFGGVLSTLTSNILLMFLYIVANNKHMLKEPNV